MNTATFRVTTPTDREIVLTRTFDAPRSAVFEAWTRSEAFRAAHAKAGGNKPLYLGHPQFEGFETLQTVGGGKSAVA